MVRKKRVWRAAVATAALVGVSTACSHSGTHDSAQDGVGQSASGSISAAPQQGTSPASGTARDGKSGAPSGKAQPSQQTQRSPSPGPSQPVSSKGTSNSPTRAGHGASSSPKGPTHGATSSPVAVEVPVSTNPDPCKITTGSTVGKAFGAKITNETAGRSGTGAYLCRFSLTKTNAGPAGTVQMSQISPESAATFAKVRAGIAGAKKVSGVGDAAFYVPRTHTLQVRRGHTVVVITADLRSPLAAPASATKTRADLVALGRLIADQI